LQPVAFTLPNGLHVIVQTKNDRPTFVLRGKIASSPAFEPLGKQGIVRLASSVADYGSGRYPFAQRRQATDEMGAFVSTGQEFSAQGEARDFEQIVEILADGEAHPTFADPWLQIERSQLANSLQSEANISGVMIDRAYNRLLLATNDPALRLPTPPSVQGITRENLSAFTAAYWRPDLTTIAVVGNLSLPRVRSALESAFGSWSAAGARPDPHLMPLPPASSGHDYIGTAANQVYIRLGQPAISRSNRDYDTFLVLNQILGGSGAFESRLWQELRQKRGLVYTVSSSLEADADRGDFRVELNASPQRVVEAVEFVRRELQRLQDEPVSATELQEAKSRLVGNALLDEASASGQAKQLLDIATNDLPLEYYRTLSERFAQITPADVQRVARAYLRPSRLVEVYAGPTGPWAQHTI
jgi:zinc protease